MLQVSDVTDDEQTAGRKEDYEQDKVQDSAADKRPSPQIPQTIGPIETLTVAHSSSTTIIKQQQQPDKIISRPRNGGQGKRRVIRRIRRAVTKFFTHDMPLLRSPQSIRAMPLRARINLYLSHPEESHVGWRLQQFLMLILFINIGAMASETVDGPRFGSSDPDYPWMPGNDVFNDIEAFFSIVYVVEFAVRWASTPNQKQFWRSKSTWITFLAAIAALPRLGVLAMGTESKFLDTVMYNMRIFRGVRLIVLAEAYVGTKVLFRAVTASISPLTITLFFLITVVMVFATAIFYAQPCYDLQTCTFTDILNTGYFVMLTVATVGYGSQVPSLHNAGALLLVCIVILFGTVYFSMPLAIVGIKYELAWAEYDQFVRDMKLGSKHRLLQVSKPSSKLPGIASRRHSLNDMDDTKNDNTLERIEAHTIKYASSVTCDRFYKLSQAMLDVNYALELIISPTDLTTADAPKTLETIVQTTKRRSDEASHVLDGIMSVIKLHSRVCAEAHELLSSLKTPSQDRETELDRFMSSSKFASKDLREFHGSQTISKMNRAKGALASISSKAARAISRRDYHAESNSLRARIWNIFENREESWTAHVLNRVRMSVIVLSIGVFYLQTTPELQKTGVQTFLCERNVHDYCARYNEPGCYVFKEVEGSGTNISVEVTDQRLNLYCVIGDPDETCYFSGVNFGSDNFPLLCSDAFPSSYGIEHVCNNRLCNPPVQFLFDMEPYWVYIEFFFGIWFTLELALRVYSHPVRRHLFGDLKVLGNLVVLTPFYVEVVEILVGEWPTYSVVPAIPSFFSVIRFLKSLRILKLGSHIPGSRVLIKTAQLVTDRLAIPLFFLFMGCVLSAAVFFELERGTECYVGQKCMWWHINVLTPKLAAGLPTGKRVLVQNTKLTIITDMLRSTWFSLVSFTTVGYGDLVPRTSLGRLVDIIGAVFASCYTAMPLTLVGGQFYICYELHTQEKRLRKERAQQRIMPGQNGDQSAPAVVQSMMEAFPSSRELVKEPISPGIPSVYPTPNDIQASFHAADSLPILPSRSTSIVSSPGTVREDEEPSALQSYTPATEIQIVNNFFLMQKVFHETIKDISSLTQMGIERVNAMRKNLSEAATVLADVRQREQVIETKIAENMDFCVTACLNFSTMMERIVWTRQTKKKQPLVIQTNALLAAAEITNELLQTSGISPLSNKSHHSKKSIGGADMTPDTTKPRPKGAPSLKRIATLSKVLAGPATQNQKTQKVSKWAEYTSKTDQG